MKSISASFWQLLALAVTVNAGPATTGLYSFTEKLALVRIEADGSHVTIGQASINGVPGEQETAIVPETKTLYLLAYNMTKGGLNTVLIGVSLDDASTKFEAPTPIAQVSKFVGVGQTINYAGSGKLVVTGIDSESGLHTAWSVDPSQGHKFIKLSSGFLPSEKYKIDPAYNLDAVHNVLWLVTKGSTTAGTDPRVVGINLTSGTTIANHTDTDSTMPKAMAYDETSGKLIAFLGEKSLASVCEIDTATFAIKTLAKPDPKFKPGYFFSGLAAFDQKSRTIYGTMETTDQPPGLLLVSYSLTTSAMTVVNLDSSAGDPFNIDFYNAV